MGRILRIIKHDLQWDSNFPKCKSENFVFIAKENSIGDGYEKEKHKFYYSRIGHYL